MTDQNASFDLPHAFDRVADWREQWRANGSLALLLDFDGTLAPIVDRPDAVAVPERTRRALHRLRNLDGVHLAIVSGRGLADARRLADLEDIAYAGNHGMEIEGAGLDRVHPEAAAARPRLEAVIERLRSPLAGIRGALLEDKGLTLSIHYRLVDRSEIERVRALVLSAAADSDLRVTEGKEVLEVRPRVDWHKGRAVEFLVKNLAISADAPIIYIGDDTTDEDAFTALDRFPHGEGVVVADALDRPTAAQAYVRTAEEVGELLDLLGSPAG